MYYHFDVCVHMGGGGVGPKGIKFFDRQDTVFHIFLVLRTFF